MDPQHNEEENPINLGDDDDSGDEEEFDYNTLMSKKENTEEINQIWERGVTLMKKLPK